LGLANLLHGEVSDGKPYCHGSKGQNNHGRKKQGYFLFHNPKPTALAVGSVVLLMALATVPAGTPV
jgi:hypothetical protein